MVTPLVSDNLCSGKFTTKIAILKPLQNYFDSSRSSRSFLTNRHFPQTQNICEIALRQNLTATGKEKSAFKLSE